MEEVRGMTEVDLSRLVQDRAARSTFQLGPS